MSLPRWTFRSIPASLQRLSAFDNSWGCFRLRALLDAPPKRPTGRQASLKCFVDGCTFAHCILYLPSLFPTSPISHSLSRCAVQLRPSYSFSPTTCRTPLAIVVCFPYAGSSDQNPCLTPRARSASMGGIRVDVREVGSTVSCMQRVCYDALVHN